MIVGLISGPGSETASRYYKVINDILKRCDNQDQITHLCIYNLSYADYDRLLEHGNEKEVLTKAINILKNGGASVFVFCTQYLHQAALSLKDELNIKVIHLGEACKYYFEILGYRNVTFLDSNADFDPNNLFHYHDDIRFSFIQPEKSVLAYFGSIISEIDANQGYSSTTTREIEKEISYLNEKKTECIILCDNRLTPLIAQLKIETPVFLLGDMHSCYVAYYIAGSSASGLSIH